MPETIALFRTGCRTFGIPAGQLGSVVKLDRKRVRRKEHRAWQRSKLGFSFAVLGRTCSPVNIASTDLPLSTAFAQPPTTRSLNSAQAARKGRTERRTTK